MVKKERCGHDIERYQRKDTGRRVGNDQKSKRHDQRIAKVSFANGKEKGKVQVSSR